MLSKICSKMTLSRNILIHKQICELVSEFNRNNIKFILLKGSALIEIFAKYAFFREMEDIDILVWPKHFLKAKEVLLSIGYICAKNDPHAFICPTKPAYIDLCEQLWYLDRAENIQVFKDSKFGVLSPEDFYIHIFAHAFLHHAKKEKTWENDLQLLSEKWANKIDKVLLISKLKRHGFYRIYNNWLKHDRSDFFYSWFLNNEIPLKGHIFRFIFLPLRKKILYLNRIFFPSVEFLIGRYSLKNVCQAAYFRIVRPVLLVRQLLKFISKVPKFLFYGSGQ